MSKIDRMIAEAKLFRDDAHRKVQEIQKQIASLDTTIEQLESLKANSPMEVLERLLSETKLPSDHHPAYYAQIAGANKEAVLSPLEVAQRVQEVLQKSGRPMKRGQLVKALAAQNVPLAGKDKNKNLGTILWRHPALFVSLPKLGYWVKGVPLPGVYDPENHQDSDSE